MPVESVAQEGTSPFSINDYYFTVVGNLLLKSNGVTLLPLLVKETSYF
jgi:hypothetical protein